MEQRLFPWSNYAAFAYDPALRHLSLEYLSLDTQDMGGFTELRSLSMRNCALNDNKVTRIAEGCNITSLDLSNRKRDEKLNSINEDTARSLGSNSSLTILSLNKVLLYGGRAAALATSASLTVLSVRGCLISADGAKALALNTALKSLDLSRNPLNGEVAQFEHNTTLTKLVAAKTGLHHEGVAALGRNQSITDLVIDSCSPGELGAEALAANSTILKLEMSYSFLDTKAVKALAKNQTITDLDLFSSLWYVDPDAVDCIAEIPYLLKFTGWAKKAQEAVTEHRKRAMLLRSLLEVILHMRVELRFRKRHAVVC